MSSETRPSLVGVPDRLGRYELFHRLASGGMGSVWLARALGTGDFEKIVAVKTLHAHLWADQAAVDMFNAEARIVSALNHPNVCQVFDFGEESGVRYLVMEYLYGQPISRVFGRLVKAGPGVLELLPSVAARVFAEAADGLHAAHELRNETGNLLGVVHRDVSPDNVFVTYGGVAKVVDFGIARTREHIRVTVDGGIRGKIRYSAPERFQDAELDRRVDVWALGVCLWEFLALRPLFRQPDLNQTLYSIMTAPIPPPSAVRSGAPSTLDAIVARALERDPDRRYSTARELSRDLRDWLRKYGRALDAGDVGDWLRALFPDREPAPKERSIDAAKARVVFASVTPTAEPAPRPTPPTAGAALASPTAASTLLETMSDSQVEEAIELAPARGSEQQGMSAVPEGAYRTAVLLGGRRARQLLVAAAGALAVALSAGVVVQALRSRSVRAVAVAAGGDPGVRDEPAGRDGPKAQTNTPLGASLRVAADAGLPSAALVLSAAPKRGDGGEDAVRSVLSRFVDDAGLPAADRLTPGRGLQTIAPTPQRPPAPQRRPRPPVSASPRERPSGRGSEAAPPDAAPNASGELGVGWLRINAPPDRYEVLVDGKPVGTSPLRVEVPAGEHRVEVRDRGAARGPQQVLQFRHAREYSIDLR
jgi:serine/threonine protein kinase